MNKILEYSAKKINANPPLLYSILNPDTNSDSPSAKSKGVRLVSANLDLNQTIAKGKQITTNHTLCCIILKFIKLYPPTKITKESKINANLTS